jgi:hypothetical protein
MPLQYNILRKARILKGMTRLGIGVNMGVTFEL